LVAIFNPTRTINEVTTSEKDSIASAIRAYEFPSIPAIAFIAASRILEIIPTTVE